MSSAQTTHGTVGVPGVRVPAATRGSSASLLGIAFSEHASSAPVDAAHGPKPELDVSSTLTWPAVPRPTACQWKAPSAAVSPTILAANTCSLSRKPSALLSVSYHTTHATLSFAPVNATSGSIPLRLGSMFSVGSPLADEPPLGSRRSRPTCCQQNRLTLWALDGLNPEHGLPGIGCLTPFETKIW